MNSKRLRGCRVIIVALAVLTASIVRAPSAAAQEKDATSGEPGRHFRHGVQLYGEADYAGALVEFKRALALAPTSTALYNVGETQYQLQDYASALTTFLRFLGEFGPTESHRADVERAVNVLRTRVGHLGVTTVPAGADLTLDEQAVGKTPLRESLLVSVGHRKLVASMAGRLPVTRYVDVAAEDNVSVSLPLTASPDLLPAVPMGAPFPARVTAPRPHAFPLRTVGLVVAGALAAGAVTFGVLAVEESSALKNARNAFPASGTTINHDASLTTTYSALADSLAVATLAVAGIALYATLSSSVEQATAKAANASSPVTAGPKGWSRVMLGPTSARFEMTF